jgi:hypothetical protein
VQLAICRVGGHFCARMPVGHTAIHLDRDGTKAREGLTINHLWCSNVSLVTCLTALLHSFHPKCVCVSGERLFALLSRRRPLAIPIDSIYMLNEVHFVSTPWLRSLLLGH